MHAKTIRLLWALSAFLLVAMGGVKLANTIASLKAKLPIVKNTKDISRDIYEIGLDTLLEKVVLQKKDRWVLVSPEKYAADQPSVEAMVSSLAGAQVEDRVSSRKERLGDFGLGESEAIKITAKDNSGQALVAGRLGKSVVGRFDRCYFAFNDSDDIYIAKIARYHFDLKSANLKDRLILEAPKDKISSLEIRSGKEVVVLKPKNATWTVNGKQAKEDKVNEILNTFTRLEANDFASPNEIGQGLKSLGLEKKPEISVSIALTEGTTLSFLVGMKKDTLYYAKLADRPTIWKLEEWKVNPLKVKAADLAGPAAQQKPVKKS